MNGFGEAAVPKRDRDLLPQIFRIKWRYILVHNNLIRCVWHYAKGNEGV